MNYLVSIQKDEHPYIQEWFNHHKQFGFDRIVVFNNSVETYQIFDEDYTEFDVSNINNPQPQCYNLFYNNFMKEGDTATFLDGDEFLESKLTISEIWNKFPTADCLRFSWLCHGDNGHALASNEPVQERFKNPAPVDCVFNADLPKGITENWHTKLSIRKTDKPAFISIHNALIQGGVTVDMKGHTVNPYSAWIMPVYEVAFIHHYITKSAEEYCKRRFQKTDACGNIVADVDKLIERYFNLNKLTKEKEEVFEKYRSR